MRSTAVALVVITGLLASACSASDSGSGAAATRGLAHIHGLGVDPADETLYAGTHYGVYRLSGAVIARRYDGPQPRRPLGRLRKNAVMCFHGGRGVRWQDY